MKKSICLAIVAACTAVCHAQFTYPFFTGTEPISLVGTAAYSNGRIELTPPDFGATGAAWHLIRQSVRNGFQTEFEFEIKDGDGADGLAFVVQNESPTASSLPVGGGIGYFTIRDGVAIEFDTFWNPEFDPIPASEHVAVTASGIGGTLDHQVFLGSTPVSGLRGGVRRATIVYDGGLGILTVVLDGVAVLGVPISLETQMALADGKAWVGFTGCTGSLTDRHEILSWTFKPNTEVQPPFSFDVTLGRLQRGNELSLVTEDGDELQVCKFVVPNQSVPPVSVIVAGNTFLPFVANYRLTTVSRMLTNGAFRIRTQAFNFSTNTFTTLGSDTVGTTPVRLSYEARRDANDLVDADGTLLARYEVFQTGPAALAVWCHAMDLVEWELQ